MNLDRTGAGLSGTQLGGTSIRFRKITCYRDVADDQAILYRLNVVFGICRGTLFDPNLT
jgi:hypothetical protein